MRGENHDPDVQPVAIPMQTDDSSLLERLVVDNADLEQLESLLDKFNLFEAIGVVRQELRHSDFLAFILNPGGPHGLGDAVLKRLLQKVLSATPAIDLPLTLIDLDVWDLGQTTVAREAGNVDLLLENQAHKLVIIIENKIDSSEHDDQLQRYYDHVHRERPGWKLVGILLTPEGDEPSDKRYLAASYGQVAEAIDHVTERRASTIGTDVRQVASHYTDMLRRYIVGGSEVDELCIRIYRKHQRALDLIFERRPDQQEVVRQIWLGFVRNAGSMTLDHDTKWAVRFLPAAWDIEVLKKGTGWTPSGRMLLFEFENKPGTVRLSLYIGPGPDTTRTQVFEWARAAGPPMQTRRSKLGKSWNSIWSKPILSAKELEESSSEQLEAALKKHWDEFLKSDVPAIEKLILTAPWMVAGQSSEGSGEGVEG